MENEIITFEKSFNQRLEELKNLLDSGKVLPSSRVRSEWSYLAELVLEPIGWKALWKIPSDMRKKLGVTTSVLTVMVDSVNTKDLVAEVSVLNSQEKNIPKQLIVFLVDLYATVHQVNDALYVKETSDFIDKLRFFYHHLWMPWDIDDDDTQSWTTLHLQPRLKLYYDLRSGSISSEMVLQIQYLIAEGRRIQAKISALEDQDEDEDEVNVETLMYNLVDLHYCKDQLKLKFEMYEDPYKRSLLVWKKCHKSREADNSINNQQTVYVIWPGGPLKSYVTFLSAVKGFIKEEDFVKSSFQLQESLNQCFFGDSMLLAEGSHGLLGLGGLEKGGAIRGLGSPESTILRPHDAGNVLLDCSGGVITLENLTIDIQNMQIAILVHDATLHLRNCRIIGENSSSSMGVLILQDGCVVAQDCVFSGLGAALVIYSKGEASLTSCKIKRSSTGMKVQDDAKVNLMKCEISECFEFGIKVEISKQVKTRKSEIGSSTLLNSVGEIQLSDTNIKNNIQGDVCILQKNVEMLNDTDMQSPSFSFLLFNNPPFVCPGKGIEGRHE